MINLCKNCFKKYVFVEEEGKLCDSCRELEDKEIEKEIYFQNLKGCVRELINLKGKQVVQYELDKYEN